MFVCQLVVLLTWASLIDGHPNNVDKDVIAYDYNRIVGQDEEKMPQYDISDTKDKASMVKNDVDFRHDVGEFYYESLQEPIVETDVLAPIQREELPIPLNDRAKKRELIDDDEHWVEVSDEEEDKSPPDVNVQFGRHYERAARHNILVKHNRVTRNTAKCNAQRRVFPESREARKGHRPLEPYVLGDECFREPPFDLSWMTCDAEIQDWAYRKNQEQSDQKTRWNGVANVAPSPSFKQITDGFWREQSGAGFLVMYNKVKTSYKNKLEKREVCGKREVTDRVHSKWETLKDKVLEVRRDIRMRMIRKAELGQLPEPGMIFLRDEELISDAMAMNRF